MVKRLVILGSGPAGLTAAIYASRAKIDTTVISGCAAGGQLMITLGVEDFPGFPEGILGSDLIAKMKKQAQRFGTKFVDSDVTRVDFSQDSKRLWLGDKEIEAEAVILAIGSSAKWLGIPSEEKLIGRGVSACATCDAPFFKDKVVGVVGGGDAAIKEAIYLTKFASQVVVIHRRDQLRAFQILQDRAKTNPKIEFLWNKVVEEVLGEVKVEGVTLKDVKTNKTSKVELQGLFIAIGHTPNTVFLKNQIDLDEKGYIKIIQESKFKIQNEKGEVIGNRFSTMTSVEGVFAAGDVADWCYRQAVTAAGSGCKAALDVQNYLEDL